MNNEVIFQNNDQHLDNPLNEPIVQKNKFTLPKDKRILALIGLGVVILILLVIALIVTSSRKTPKNNLPPTSTPTETPTQIITPTPIAVPTEFQTIINQINQSLNPTPEVFPPQIDDTIGL